MKLICVLYCISLLIAMTACGIPLVRPGDNQDHLAKNCRIPKCPESKEIEGEEIVVKLRYPLDCLVYVECRGSVARVLPCPPDEVFDKETFTCGPRNKVRCVPCYQEAPQT